MLHRSPDASPCRSIAAAAATPPALWAGPAAASPLGYLTAHGAKAAEVLPLTYGLGAISAATCLVILGLLAAAILRSRAAATTAEPRALAVERSGGGLKWIYIGVGASTAVLFVAAAWTMVVLAATSAPPSKPRLTVEVTGHLWWWGVRYLDDDPSKSFTTANEIHVPVGEPVAVRLMSADVIHSFWAPALSGKTDVIPGQTNTTWLQADRPGVYRGQCAEYCGRQHAHMAFVVVAQKPEEFEAWRAAQLKPPPPPTGDLVAAKATFQTKCGLCHAVRGTEMGGVMGPDLSHLPSRRFIAAGTLPNTPGNLGAWIADPQHVKPGAKMPRVDVSGPELAQIYAYIASLK